MYTTWYIEHIESGKKYCLYDHLSSAKDDLKLNVNSDKYHIVAIKGTIKNEGIAKYCLTYDKKLDKFTKQKK